MKKHELKSYFHIKDRLVSNTQHYRGQRRHSKPTFLQCYPTEKAKEVTEWMTLRCCRKPTTQSDSACLSVWNGSIIQIYDIPVCTRLHKHSTSTSGLDPSRINWIFKYVHSTSYQPISHVFPLISMNRDPPNRGEYKLRYLAYKPLAGFTEFLNTL